MEFTYCRGARVSAQVEKWGQHYWVVYYDDNRNRFDESGPYTEAEDAEDCLERNQ